MKNPNTHTEPPTPELEVETILYFLRSFYEAANFGTRAELMEEFDKVKHSSGDQVHYFAKMHAETEKELRNASSVGVTPSIGKEIQLAIVYSALAHCVQALRSDLTRDERWQSVCWAHSQLGQIRGSLSGERFGEISSTNARAKNAAVGRHKENHAMKKEVFSWLDENMSRFKSMEDAAMAIATGQTPIKARTAREWICQWKLTKSTPEKTAGSVAK